MNYEQRKAAMSAEVGKPKARKVADLLNMTFPPSSHERLLELGAGSWEPALFRSAAEELLRDYELRSCLYTSSERLPPLPKDANHKYWPQYRDLRSRFAAGERLLVVTIIEGDNIVGFGIGRQGEGETEIEIIDVDQFSRRRAGVKRSVMIGDAVFDVGIAHIVVQALLSRLDGLIVVDAANSESQYVFRSFGFMPSGGGNGSAHHLTFGTPSTKHQTEA